MKILFLGETYRADAQTWIKGIEEASGCKIDTDEIKTIRFKPIRAMQAFFFIFRLILGRYFGPKYDIVLAERSTSYGFFSLFTNAKVKVVAQQGITDIFPNTFLSRGYKKFLQRLVYRKVDVIHAWGNAMVPAMLNSGADPKKILVLPKGINLSNFIFENHFKTEENKEITAVVTRSLFPEYRHDIIFHSLAELKKRKTRVNLIVVGNGPLLNEYRKMIDDLDIADCVTFKGRIDNKKLPEIFAKCNLYLSVPITEGASSSLMEAMASGLFPIVTNLPGNRSFITPNHNGFLVEVDNSNDLTNKIGDFISLANRSKREMVLFNRNYAVERFNTSENMNFFFNLYSSVNNKSDQG